MSNPAVCPNCGAPSNPAVCTNCGAPDAPWVCRSYPYLDEDPDPGRVVFRACEKCHEGTGEFCFTVQYKCVREYESAA
jgi:hypothetical protein